MKLTDSYPYSAIIQILRHGEENAISAGEIVSVLGLPDTRTLRLYIEKLRDEECILSSARGYYLPKNKEEAERWRRKMLRFMGKYARLARSADRMGT